MTPCRTRLRFPPCPAYDVEGTESWLSDMAAQGWTLAQDGIFCGVATFERAEPQKVRYRLAAARESTSMWAPGGGYPDQDEVETSARMGWEYVANRGQFYIYRTDREDVRELDTDPAVQALAVEEVRKRQVSSLVSLFIWMFLYPLVYFRGTLFLLTVELGSAVMLPALGLGLWYWASALREYLSLRRLKRRLEAGESLEHRADWQSKRRWYQGLRLARWLLLILVLSLTLRSLTAAREREIPLEEYRGKPPFATLAELAGKEIDTYEGTGWSSAEEWSDLISPVNLHWHEVADIRCADGTELSGGIYIDYHETVSPWVAQCMAREYRRWDRWRSGSRRYQELECPALEADQATVYAYNTFFPTVVFCKGKVVVRAYAFGFPMEEWAPALAASIK